MTAIYQRTALLSACLIFILISIPQVAAQTFTDVTSTAGVHVVHDGASVSDMGMGTGAAWFDYDNDGDQDLYMTMRTGANMLFQNNGGTFTDVALAAGVQDANHDGSGVAVADFDNDGDKDFYLANGDADVLFRNNGDGTFTDITAGSGLETSEERRGTTASWGDYNNDGFVDLYVANHMAVGGTTVTGATEQIKAQDYIYHNNGDGTFTDVSDMLLGVAREGMSFIGGWTDYDSDGDLDIFVINDCPFDSTAPEQMYRNDGGTNGTTDWTFTEVSAVTNTDWCQNGMGLAVGDYDRDGDFDFFFSDNGSNGTVPVDQQSRPGTMLLRNDNGIFADATVIGDVSSLAWSWGANFFDYDLDGYQDLYLAAGSMNTFDPLASVLWQNNGDGSFTDVSASSGGLDDTERTRTSVYGDYDGDGDPDMFLVNYAGNTKLFRNDQNTNNNWVIFDLEGVTSNRDGIGAKLELVTPDGSQYFETRSGSSLGGGDDLGAYFGLGSTSTITTVHITWPSGTQQTVFAPGINQRHLIVEEATPEGSVLAVSPVEADFGQVNEGGSSAPTTFTLTNQGDDPLDVSSVTLVGADAADFAHSFAGPLTLAAGATSTFDVTFSPLAEQAPSMQLPEGVLYRINAGGPLLSDWEEDSDTNPSPYILPGTSNFETDGVPPVADSSVPEGTPVDLFATNRIDADQPEPYMQWDLPVTAGEPLEVRLFFVEMSRCLVGDRVFDVEIEGQIVIEDLDIFVEAGNACNVGIMRSIEVTPLDGNLDINLPLINGKPSVLAGIEIVGSGTSAITPRAAQLMIDHTGINPSLNVALTGESVSSTVGGSILSVSPTAIDFGEVNLNTTATTTVTMTNTGVDPIDVSSVTLTGTDLADFNHTFAAPVSLTGGTSTTFDVSFSPTSLSQAPQIQAPVSASTTVLYRVNAGGDLVDDWEEDTSTLPSPYLVAGTTNIETDGPDPILDISVPAGTPQDLFRTKRIDADQPEPYMNWDFPVTPGQEIEVRLYFVEMSRCSVGSRVFDVTMEGEVVLDDLDIYAESGDCNVGIMRAVNVTPLDDNLDIEFPLVNGKPAVIAGFEITGASGGSSTSGRTAQITVEHNGLNSGNVITLDGIALDEGGPTLATTPPVVNFGTVIEGTDSEPATITMTNNGSVPLDVTNVSIVGDDASEFNATFSGPVTIGAGSTGTFDVMFSPSAPSSATSSSASPSVASPTPLAPGDIVYRVNVGGGLIDDWIKDSENSPSPYIITGTSIVEEDATPAAADASVPAGTPVGLFNSKRIDANQPEPYMQFAFPVTANQSLEVRMYFVELSRCAAGNRVFNVEIEGSVLLENLDVYAEAGNACNMGIMRSFIVIPDDTLNIQFPLVNGKPSSVAAIEILESSDVPSTFQTAQLQIEHTGANGTQTVELQGESTPPPPNEAPVASFSSAAADSVVTFTDESTDDSGVVSWSWDFGDGNTSTDQNPVHAYDLYGTYTITLIVSDEPGLTDTLTTDLKVRDPAAPLPYLEENGLVVMEAENFFTNTDRSDNMWVETTAIAGYSGAGAMSGEPNDDDLFKKANVDSSPEMTYEVDFSILGTYYVWARVYAAVGEDNSFHAGLNSVATASKMEVTTYGAWTWTNLNTKGKSATIGLTDVGENVINFWMREDGLIVDKIVLTTDANFIPTGTGPAESGRIVLGPSVASSANSQDESSKTSITDSIEDVPTEFALEANYPNPFNPTTTIQYALPEDASVTLEVFDAMGRLVATLVNGQQPAGRYESQWNGRSDAGNTVASGMYLYRLRAGQFVQTRTMLLMK